jgi:hypothetical protein
MATPTSPGPTAGRARRPNRTTTDDIQIFAPWSDTDAEFDPELRFCCLEPGAYTIRGYYVPENFDPSSGDAPITITKNGSTATLEQSSSTSAFGESVTFDIHVGGYSSDPRAAKPTGFVDVREGPTTYGTAALDANGDATITTSQLPAGTRSLRAFYTTGDSRYEPSASTLVEHVVTGGATTTSLVASPTSITYGQPLTLTTTVEVVAPVVGTAEGEVTFHDGGIAGPAIGSASLNEGTLNQATLTTSELSAGSHTIVAVYGGNPSFDGGASNTVTVNVSKAASSTSLSSSTYPSEFGQPVTFTATLDGPGTTTVPGTVQFKAGGVNIGTPQPLIVGIASITIGTLPGGSHSITAVYSGSASYHPSSASPSQVVTCDETITGTASSITVWGSGTNCLSGAKITGNVTIPAGASVSILNTTIGGNLTGTGSPEAAITSLSSLSSIVGGPGAVTMCGSTVGGNVTLSGASGFLLLGDLREDGCAGNWFRGTVSLRSNHGGLALADNRIGGGVSVIDNVGTGPTPDHLAPEIEANKIGGYLTVAGNSPIVTNDERPNTVRGNRSGQLEL